MALEQARWHAEDRAMHQGLEGLACEENGMENAAECERELRNGGARGRKRRSQVEHRAMQPGAMGLDCETGIEGSHGNRRGAKRGGGIAAGRNGGMQAHNAMHQAAVGLACEGEARDAGVWGMRGEGV